MTKLAGAIVLTVLVTSQAFTARAELVIQAAKAATRTEGGPMNLITSDEYAPYKRAVLKAYSEEVTPPRTGKPGRPQGPYHVPPPELNYATVHKTREKGRVVKVDYAQACQVCRGRHGVRERVDRLSRGSVRAGRRYS